MNREEHNHMKMKEVFPEVQQIGGEEFGPIWLKANDDAVSQVERNAGFFDTTLVEVKTLMVITILSVLRTSRDLWFPIETAPKDGTSFLVGDLEKGYVNRAFYMDGALIIVGGNHKATHWRPLPEISENAIALRS